MKKGMVLPFEPHSITIDEVTYSIDMPQVSREDGILLWCDAIHKQDNFLYYVEIFMKWKFKELLKIDWCFWRAWVVLSGPVSLQLWWVLVVQEKWLWSGRKTGGYIKGDIKISGYPKKQETFFFFFYCEQNDIHSPQVTVYESLLYSAWLRRPLEIDAETRKVGIYIVFHLHIKHLFFRASSKFMFLLTFFF